jgi:hypothetical protein
MMGAIGENRRNDQCKICWSGVRCVARSRYWIVENDVITVII